MTTTVRQILAGRAGVYMVSPDDTIFDALRLMAERNIGAVLVMSDPALELIASAFLFFTEPARQNDQQLAAAD